ncbi:MAG: (2Fe-2S)-binding protein [Candidatus Latescibacteria bacterium]|nr:(2Fe-2S)-binding protein [Candidatus Latescibacterota bacterium]
MAELSIFPDNITTKVEPGTSILEASLEAGIPHTHLCGGKSRCSTCRVLIIEGIENCSPRNGREQEIADGLHYPPSLRLACQTTIDGDVSLRRLVVDQEDVALTSQLVVERVRAEVMAMRGSDDFVNIVRVLWQGLLDVGLDVDYCALDILDEDPNTCETHAITSTWIEEWCDIAPLKRSVVVGGHYYCSHHLLNDHQ